MTDINISFFTNKPQTFITHCDTRWGYKKTEGENGRGGAKFLGKYCATWQSHLLEPVSREKWNVNRIKN